MTTRYIQLVQQTFEMILPQADTYALLFYERFFALEPEVRPLFPDDMAAQRQKLMETLALLVRGLDQPEKLIEYLQELGQRHEGYRVRPPHYAAMNQALVATLADCLGERFTAELRQAWEESLAIMAAIMQGEPIPATVNELFLEKMG